MSPFHPDVQRHSFLRPPDWRWQRACRLVARNRYFSRRRDDEETGRAMHYLRALARCRHGAPSARLLKQYGEVHAAHRLNVQGGQVRLLVEARLLARQSFEQTAQALSISPGTVFWFEALFFNVVEHLDARDWVVARTIGRGASAGTADPDTGVVLKSFAYFGGLIVLEAVLPYLVGGKDLFDPPPDLSTQEGRRDQMVRLAVAAHLLPEGAATDKKLHKIMEILRERGRNRPVRPAPAPLLAQNVDFLLEELPVGACPGHVDAMESTLHATVPEPSGQVA
jgi:hypothetical protein